MDSLKDRFERLFGDAGLWKKVVRKFILVSLATSAVFSPQVFSFAETIPDGMVSNKNKNVVEQLISYASSVKLTEEHKKKLETLVENALYLDIMRSWNSLNETEKEQVKHYLHSFLSQGKDLQNVGKVNEMVKAMFLNYVEEENEKVFIKGVIFPFLEKSYNGYKKLKEAHISFDDIPQFIEQRELPFYIKLVTDRLNDVTGLNIKIDVEKYGKYSLSGSGEERLIDGYITFSTLPNFVKLTFGYRDDQKIFTKDEVLSVVFHEYGHALSFGHFLMSNLLTVYVAQFDFLSEEEKRILIDRIILVNESTADNIALELSSEANVDYSEGLCKALADPQDRTKLHSSTDIPVNIDRFSTYCNSSSYKQKVNSYLAKQEKKSYVWTKFWNEGGVFASFENYKLTKNEKQKGNLKKR